MCYMYELPVIQHASLTVSIRPNGRFTYSGLIHKPTSGDHFGEIAIIEYSCTTKRIVICSYNPFYYFFFEKLPIVVVRDVCPSVPTEHSIREYIRFARGTGTTDAVATVMNNISTIKALGPGCSTRSAAVFLDLEKAFELVSSTVVLNLCNFQNGTPQGGS